jgi:hypothetical protein
MRILFVLKQRNYLTTYAGAIAALVARGHAMRLAWPDEDTSLPDELAAAGVTVEVWTPARGDAWASLAGIVRRASDYLRYLEPGYRDAVKLRDRAFDKLVHSISKGTRQADPRWGEIGLDLSPLECRRLATLLGLVEEAMPSDPRHETFIASSRPDVVLVSPLIDLGSAQTDVVKAAKRLGIPTGMVLFSWDNLSTKGGLHVHPDRLFVWNELQRQEAVELHGYPLERTIATGAPRFDEFFSKRRLTDRAAFHAPLGLDPAKPTLMYLGSSKFVVAGTELPFIASWVREIRQSSDDRLRTCNIIVRPHPDVKAAPEEGEVEVIRWPGLPGRGWLTRPVADPAVVFVRSHYRRPDEFYDALYHSAAVVGLNTSAALEAAIVGRPVFTIVAGDDAADGQASTLHFHYLLREHGGCVSLAATFDQHREQLASALRGEDRGPELRAFAESFVRPAGWDVTASQVLADAIERAFGSGGAR